MAATEKKQVWLFSDNGVAPVVEEGRIAASQGAYMAGTPCYMSTSGQLKLCVTSAASASAIHGVLLAGVAAAQAANTMVRWARITGDQVWAIYAENAGTDVEATVALIGNIYGITVSATAGEVGYTTCDIGNANTAVKVMSVLSDKENIKSAITDAPGVLLVSFLQANIDADDS